jgi:hypothetical protein
MTRDRSDQSDAAKANQKRELEQALDQGLLETFPGSDAVSVVQPAPSKYDARIKREPEKAQ